MPRRAPAASCLASLVSVLLCAVAIAMTARRYVKRHLDPCALLKTLGATRAVTLELMRPAAGCDRAAGRASPGPSLGFLAQEWLLRTCAACSARTCRRPSWHPLAWVSHRAAVLTGFALPSMLQLARVPAIRVLRRDIGPPPPR